VVALLVWKVATMDVVVVPSVGVPVIVPSVLDEGVAVVPSLAAVVLSVVMPVFVPVVVPSVVALSVVVPVVVPSVLDEIVVVVPSVVVPSVVDGVVTLDSEPLCMSVMSSRRNRIMHSPRRTSTSRNSHSRTSRQSCCHIGCRSRSNRTNRLSGAD